MATINVDCFQDEYFHVLNWVAAHGIKRAPRGLPTRDLGYTTLTVWDIAQPVLPLRTGRHLGKTVAALETLQLIGEVSTPDLLLRAAPRFEEYVEHDAFGNPSHFHGAYGARVGRQVDAALEKLKSDSDTRQAVITLWNPVEDNRKNKRDYPCTIALGLSIVDGMLELHTLMRSNDAWLGLPNDVFVFTQFQWTVAHALQVDPGRYIHTAWSLHLYERDLPKIDQVGPADRHEEQPRGLVCDTYDVARRTARRLLEGDELFKEDTGEERDDWVDWYRDAIASVVG